MNNRFCRLHNNEKWGPGGDSEVIGAQGDSREQNLEALLVKIASFCLRFGNHFGVKTVYFGICFYIKFRRAFLEDFDRFWTSCSWVLGSKTCFETGKAKTWKTYVLLNENLCFGGSRPLFFDVKQWKHGVGMRKGSGGVFLFIFIDFGLNFELQNRKTTMNKWCITRTRFRKRKRAAEPKRLS